jgi:hypothetical protein
MECMNSRLELYVHTAIDSYNYLTRHYVSYKPSYYFVISSSEQRPSICIRTSFSNTGDKMHNCTYR